MKIFSTFSGIGGFEIGIQNAYRETLRRSQAHPQGDDETGQGLVASQRQGSGASNGRSGAGTTDRFDQRPLFVGYSEIDKYATKVYERHFNGTPNYGDITKVNAEELPDFDCLVGGFPCQAFSIAGKRKGFEDTRGTLFFDLARILRAKQPRLFVFENVKGLLNHDGGRTFKTIIQTIDELGYDCQWQVLNSKNYGVPQNRERVYIVGHLRGTPRPEVFPIAGDGGADTRLPGHVSNTLTARYEGAQAVGTYIGESKLNAQEIRQLNNPTHSNDRVYDSDGISPTLNTMQGGNRQPKIVAQRGRYNADGKTEQQLEPRSDSISNTLTAVQKDNMVLDDMRIRRLTPIECERLQGFPDQWTAEGVDGPISDTQRYKMCGNAVTTNVVEAVFRRIFESNKETNKEQL